MVDEEREVHARGPRSVGEMFARDCAGRPPSPARCPRPLPRRNERRERVDPAPRPQACDSRPARPEAVRSSIGMKYETGLDREHAPALDRAGVAAGTGALLGRRRRRAARGRSRPGHVAPGTRIPVWWPTPCGKKGCSPSRRPPRPETRSRRRVSASIAALTPALRKLPAGAPQAGPACGARTRSPAARRVHRLHEPSTLKSASQSWRASCA